MKINPSQPSRFSQPAAYDPAGTKTPFDISAASPAPAAPPPDPSGNGIPHEVTRYRLTEVIGRPILCSGWRQEEISVPGPGTEAIRQATLTVVTTHDGDEVSTFSAFIPKELTRLSSALGGNPWPELQWLEFKLVDQINGKTRHGLVVLDPSTVDKGRWL